MIKVLVVDDSIFMRTLVSDMLKTDAGMKVGTAKSGTEALKMIPEFKPDVVTLDLMMPGWDGLTTLKKIMAECPTPVVILSAHSRKDAQITFQCLEAGAVSFVPKPSGELSLDIKNVKTHLLEEVRSASQVELKKVKSLVTRRRQRRRSKLSGTRKIVVIGSSTGGPQTLDVILSCVPSDIPFPLIVVQHMPDAFFTEGLAERLNRLCDLPVKVAENGERVEGGTVYLAPSGFEMTFEERPARDEAEGAKEIGLRLKERHGEGNSPCIDTVMRSAAMVYGEGSVGIILTGMGHDGVEGMKAIKGAGGQTLVQDASSLIFGMPKAVMDSGFADQVLPASDIGNALVECISAVKAW